MSNSHNKKRNAGLLYEFLVRHMSNSLANNDLSSYNKAMSIIDECFSQGSELYKEYRLFNALVQTTELETHIASAIMSEAKHAAKRHDLTKLDREKSVLIKRINYSCGKDLYEYRVPEYKKFASIQTLLNEWRSDDPDLRTMAQFEQKLSRWLQESPVEQVDALEENADPLGTSDLVLTMMIGKLEKKYGGKLTSEQIDLLNKYIFLEESASPDLFIESLQRLRDRVATRIDSVLMSEGRMNDLGPYVKKNLIAARRKISDYVVGSVDDECITRHMKLLELEKEL